MDDFEAKVQAANDEVEYSSANPEPIQLKESEALRKKKSDNALQATEEYINQEVT